MERTISLAGEWRITLAPAAGAASGQSGTIRFPGSVTERGYGEANDAQELLYLAERRTYTGKIVVEKVFALTEEDLAGQVLFCLERTRVTRLWVNGEFEGSRDLLTTAQVYDISQWVRAGENALRLEIDNTLEGLPRDAILGSHMATEHTQTNWLGMLGRIEIRILPAIAITAVQVYPDAAGHRARLRVHLGRRTAGVTAAAVVHANRGCQNDGSDPTRIPHATRLGITMPGTGGAGDVMLLVRDIHGLVEGENVLTEEIVLPENTPLWSEFHPDLVQLMITLETDGERQAFPVTFGLRDIGISEDHRHITVNGYSVFLRSETNCAVFPLTGYAPMEEAGWARLFDNYQALGINHIRFHSWCPPEAAFAQADRRGMYIQAELCEWTFHTFEDDAEYDYYTCEAQAILDAYGNHPSFIAMTWGNELRSGRRDRMAELCRRMRAYDPTRLYAEGSNAWYGEAGIGETSDYVMAQGNLGRMWRGTFAGNHGFVNEEMPAGNHNYEATLEGIPVPACSFEVGQFQTYPDYDEIDGYTGVLEARNLQAYQRMLAAHGMAGRDKAFHEASGRLAMLCYREEIEAALRTPGLAGISLLGVQDFSGQGTALVGMINALGEMKSYVDPAAFRACCGPFVPLLQFDRRVYQSGEAVTWRILAANYTETSPRVEPRLQLLDADGTERWSAVLEPCEVPCGGLREPGAVSLRMPTCDDGRPMILTARLQIGEYVNDYPMFVYPAGTDKEINKDIITALTDNALERIAAGERLLLLPPRSARGIPAGYPASYTPDFWCWIMFRKWDPQGTLGLCLDPEEPLFAGCPTATHTDYRWWRLLHDSRAMQVTGLPVHNLVPMIDNIQRNEELSMAFEVSYGRGSLVVCSLNLSERAAPEVRCYRRALLAYVRDKGAAQGRLPGQEIGREQLRTLFPILHEYQPTSEILAVHAGIHDDTAANVLDDSGACWTTEGLSDPDDAWIKIHLRERQNISMVRLHFADRSVYETTSVDADVPGRVSVEYDDGESYRQTEVLFTSPLSMGGENTIYFEPVQTDRIRIRLQDSEEQGVVIGATALFGYQPAAVQQITIYG